jgi:transglutaminase-like putative cysteine protease
MIYRLRHVTTYDYARPVVLGTHFMHLLPRARPGQTVREAALIISPNPESRRNEVDHFGNFTTTVAMTGPHRQFAVELTATIDVGLPKPPRRDLTPAWEDVAKIAGANPRVAEYCLPSPLASPTPEIQAYGRASFPPGQPILAGLLDLTERLFRDFKYRGGVTTTGTTAAQALKLLSGVCQDYAHLMIASLRALGLPARYVSGYLRTFQAAGEVKHRGADQSHAWASCWLGEDIGWVDFDPTNNLLVIDEHVTLAWGRDFSDVSPLRGIILGGGKHVLKVNVDLDPILT